MDYIRGRKHENLFLHENGLLYSNGTEKAVTWMNSTAGGHPVIPRTGYIVEVNSLWYNALRFIADMEREGGNVQLADELDAQAQVTGKSFIEVFRNDCGYLFDYVNGYMMDWSVRPNMIFTVAFDYSPLDQMQKKQPKNCLPRKVCVPSARRAEDTTRIMWDPRHNGIMLIIRVRLGRGSWAFTWKLTCASIR